MDTHQSIETPDFPTALVQTLPIEAVQEAEQQEIPLSTAQYKPEDQNRFRIFALLLAFLGMPLFAVIGAISLFVSSVDKMIFVDVMDKLSSHTLFITLPLFTFAGYVLSASKAPERLVRFSRALLGWVPGGTAFIAVISCAFFTAFTGASGVTIVALGGLLYPMLMKDQYGENFTLGMITTGGSLGLLFPPSLPLILYAVLANHSMQGFGHAEMLEVKDLFLAGVIPGSLTVLVLAVYGSLIGKKRQQEIHAFSIREFFAATWSALPELAIPAIIAVTFFGGFLQLTESAALTALYVLVIEVVVYRDIRIVELPLLFQRSMVMIGAILIILMMAMAMTTLMIMSKVPDQILLYMKEHLDSPWKFLLLLNLFLLMVGCLMDIFSAILVVVPLIIPLALNFGIHPLHLGIVFLLNLSIGYCTPPVGMNLFLASLRFQRSVFKVTYTCLPFLGLLLGVLGLVTYVPALSVRPAQEPWLIGAFFGILLAAFILIYIIVAIQRRKQNTWTKIIS